MKTNLLVTLVGLSLTSPAVAQFRIADDGIAASPKVRQTIEERRASAKATAEIGAKSNDSKTCCEDVNVAASPKVKEMWPKAANQVCGMSCCTAASAR